MEESGGKWLLMGHTENLDTHSKQLVGGDPRQVRMWCIVSIISQERQWLQTITVLEIWLSFIFLQVTYWSHCSIAMMENGMEMEELLNVGAPQLSSFGWVGQVSLS